MMVEENFSCIKEVTKSVYISVPPVYVSCEISGVKDILESWKRQYIRQLKGIVVSYKNVSLASLAKECFDVDKRFLQYCVNATFELFCPTIGSIVEAKINRVSHDYIGCLIHNIINATIKRSSKASDKISQFISLDHMILFQITFYSFHRGFIRVKGEITEDCVELMKKSPRFNTRQIDLVKSAGSIGVSSLESEDSMSIDEDNTNEDMEEESSSLLTSDYSSLRNPNFVSTFNVDNLGDETSKVRPVFDTPSPSPEGDSSSSDHNISNRMLHNVTNQESEDSSVDDKSIVQGILGHDLPASNFTSSSKKKKHKNKKSSKKKTPKKTLTDFKSQHVKSPRKKKKSKRIKQSADDKKSVDSPKKHKKCSIKLELDEESSRQLSESTSFDKKDAVSNILEDEMMNLFAKYEPSLEDQLLTIKEDPLEISKKRKQESLDEDELPTKKKKRKSNKISPSKNKDKSEKKKKSKKKDKKKSKNNSKKDKIKKSKNKVLNSKYKHSGDKVKHKKDKKKKDDKTRAKKIKSEKL